MSIFLFGNSFSQSLETSFNGNSYVLIDNHWNIFNNGNFIKTENKIYVKSYNITTQQIDFIQSNYGTTHVKTYLSHFYVFSLQNNSNLFPILKSIDSLTYVDDVQCGFIAEYHAIPNDPAYNPGVDAAQWHLKSVGFGTKVDSAWDITTGDSNIIVAVLDNGVDYYHPDLGMGADGYENIYKNPNEEPWVSPINPTTGNGVGNSIDNDGNGYIDDWKGWNFFTNSISGGTKDANWWLSPPKITNTHGTPIAGIIASKTNNGIGASGIAGVGETKVFKFYL